MTSGKHEDPKPALKQMPIHSPRGTKKTLIYSIIPAILAWRGRDSSEPARMQAAWVGCHVVPLSREVLAILKEPATLGWTLAPRSCRVSASIRSLSSGTLAFSMSFV